MIPPELRAKFRRLFFAEHWKVGTIAQELGVHHSAVERAIDLDRFLPPGTWVRPSALDPYKDFIQRTLEGHPRLRATRLFEMVKARGYPGTAVQVRRYVKKVRPTASTEAYFSRKTLPGEEAQVDWGHFGRLQIGDAPRPLSCFVLVLSWSRAIFARFALDQTLESFFRGHVEAFASLGGVPRAVLYDNLKSVVLDRIGDHIRFHPRLLDLAGHYHFAPKPCAPARGNEKGKVERTIHYLRHSFFAARRFSSLDDLNAQLRTWIDSVANLRKVPADPKRLRVHEALDEERPWLLPLPQHPFEADLVKVVASGKTPYLRFDLNDYSIPHTLVGKPLTLLASETEVRILDGQVEVARHRRCYDRGKPIEDPAHLDDLAKQKRHAKELRGRDRLRAACKNADPLLEALAVRGEPLCGQTQRLLRLLERYGAKELDQAMAEAIARGTPTASSVAHVLDQRARAQGAPPPLPPVLPDDPRVRDLYLVPHDLTPYDQLSTDEKETP